MLQSGELMQAYTILLFYIEEVLRDLEVIRESAVTAPGIDVSRQAERAKDRLEFAVTQAKAITHPATVQ